MATLKAISKALTGPLSEALAKQFELDQDEVQTFLATFLGQESVVKTKVPTKKGSNSPPTTKEGAHWVVKGTNYVVKSCRNKVVIGTLKKGSLAPLTKEQREECLKKEWSVEGAKAEKSKEKGSDSESIEKIMVNVYTNRVAEKDLPAKAWVQRGEIFGSKIKWDGAEKVTLEWSESCFYSEEPGISLGGGYSGYDSKKNMYVRYNQSWNGQEHCMRVLKEKGKPALDQTGL